MSESARLNLRLPHHLRQMLDGAAERHGRTASEEARIALELHTHYALRLDVRARAPYLRDLLDSGEAFEDFARQVEADTAALEVLAYRRPPTTADLRRLAAATN